MTKKYMAVKLNMCLDGHQIYHHMKKTLLAIWIQQFSSSICQDVFDYKELQLWGPVSEKNIIDDRNY